jgi:transcriptional regulator with XRE-family HTH domain
MTKTLRAWRAEQLLSTRRIATLSGTSNKTIVQIENGRQTPTFATIDKISRVLQVEPREVTEFALALAERSRESSVDTPVASTDGRPVAQVLCVSAVASFLTVTRRLLEAERYGVTSMIGVPVTVEQVACLQPDLVILDLGADAQRTIDLTQGLRGSPAMAQLPIVVTGRDRSRMAEAVARLDDAARQGVTLVPFDRELGDLVATVESLTRGQDDEPTE